MTFIKIVLFSVLPAVLAVAVLAGCSRSQATAGGAAAAPPPPSVSVAEVLSRPLRDFEEFTGRLEPVTTVSICPVRRPLAIACAMTTPPGLCPTKYIFPSTASRSASCSTEVPIGV